jgi:hypothetical protein
MGRQRAHPEWLPHVATAMSWLWKKPSMVSTMASVKKAEVV